MKSQGNDDVVPAAAPLSPGQSLTFKWADLYPIVLLIAALALLWPTTRSLIAEWRDDSNTTTYTHGFLIVAISFWLLYRERDRLSAAGTRPSLFAGFTLIAVSLVWLAAVRAGIQTVHQVLLPILTWLAVWTALGLRASFVAGFAIGYLYFAIPIWGHINDLLQSGTVVVVELLLRLSGVTAYVEGVYVHIASGVIEIAHGCSGLHYFIVALAIGALYGEVHRDSLKLRALQIALAIGLALATNWIRVYIIIVAGYLTDMQHYLVAESHYTFGWCVFAVAMLAFFLIVRTLPPAVAERHLREAPFSASPATATRGLVIALASLALAPLWHAAATPKVDLPLSADGLLPKDLDTWKGPSASSHESWNPTFVGADAVARGSYERDGAVIEAYAAEYVSQAQGKELIGYKNSLIDEDRERVVSLADVRDGPTKEIVVAARSPDRRFVVQYFYRVGGLRTTREIVAQSWYGISSLAGAAPSRVMAARAACDGDCESARMMLREFFQEAAW